MLFRRPTWTVLMSCRRVREHYEQISPFERGSAIGLKKAGEGQISGSLDGWVEAMLPFDDAGMNGWPMVLQSVKKVAIDQERRQNARTDSSPDRRSLHARSTVWRITGMPVIAMTFDRRLRKRGLWSRRPLFRLSLTVVHLQVRLQWCQAHSSMYLTD